jgi:rubrerythrin
MRIADRLDEVVNTIGGIELRRRDALMLAAAGAGGGASLALAACGGGGDSQQVTQTISPEEAQADAAVLNALLDLERTAVLAYSLGQRRLSGAGLTLARRFTDHERAHERAVEQAILRVGGQPARARPDRSYTSGFPALRTASDVLRFALDLENTQISAYGEALGTVVTPEIRPTLLSILATEAEHMSVLLGELHEPQATQALVTGNAPT